MSLEHAIRQAAEIIAGGSRVVVFTGAGVSTESGIPDFRGPDGVWTKFNPNDWTFQKFLASEEQRKRVWRRFRERGSMSTAHPNAAHKAIARLEELGRCTCVITQNIDGLHADAGSRTVIEIHGTTRAVKCLECDARFPRNQIMDLLEDDSIEIPACPACGGVMMKPATISFGEPMPAAETAEAFRHAEACDVFVVVGSSLVVYPAAQMPQDAKRAGAQLILVNLSDTPHDHYADLVINAKAGEVMPPIVDQVEALLATRQ